jgi:heavy metal efflux system protein
MWVRGTLAPSTGPDEAWQSPIERASFWPASLKSLRSSIRLAVPTTAPTGRASSTPNTFVNLKQKEEWRPVFHQNKDALIASMNEQLEKIPGVIWGFSQPIEDNMEEAVSGVKGELSVKDLRRRLQNLEAKGQ